MDSRGEWEEKIHLHKHEQQTVEQSIGQYNSVTKDNS